DHQTGRVLTLHEPATLLATIEEHDDGLALEGRLNLRQDQSLGGRRDLLDDSRPSRDADSSGGAGPLWLGLRGVYHRAEDRLDVGALRLDGSRRRDDASGTILDLARGGGVEGAEVNDEVSHRVLAFVAPVLDQATRVHGTVSAELERAEIPLGGDAAQRAVVE